MRRTKRGFLPFRLLLLGMGVLVLYLGGRLGWEEVQGQKQHQKMLDLGEISYDERFLEEIQKMEGFLSVSPVYEIPVRLRWGDYTTDTTFTALEVVSVV